MTVRAYAEFGGARVGTAPLTWGQRAIWKAIESVAPNDHWLNVRRLIPLSARRAVGVDAAVAAVGQLATRHESLRTRIGLAGGEPAQYVGRADRLPVDIVEVGEVEHGAPVRRLTEIDDVVRAVPAIADQTEALVRRLAGTGFRYADEWPLRAGLVVVGGQVCHLVLVLSHVAADWHATRLLLRDLRLLLARGALPPGPAATPLDLARREAASTRRTQRAIGYWLAAYRRLPVDQLPEVGVRRHPSPDQPEYPPYRQVLLTSPALAAAAPALAARHGVSTSTVLLAATAGVIGAYTGHRTCGLLAIVGNRFQPGHADIVAPMSQLGLFVLDVGDSTPAEPTSLHRLIARAWPAALLAYRHAYYDQAALDRALAAAGRGGGAEVDPYCCFNDVRTSPDNSGPATPRSLPPAAALSRSTVEGRPVDTFNWRFYLEVRDAPGALVLALTAGTRCLSPERIERFLRDLEAYVVESAMRG